MLARDAWPGRLERDEVRQLFGPSALPTRVGKLVAESGRQHDGQDIQRQSVTRSCCAASSHHNFVSSFVGEFPGSLECRSKIWRRCGL
eukprot:3057521-Pyramimonas_sp.AAC.1